jgi:hypothetical protein
MSVARRILVAGAALLLTACGALLALDPLQFDERAEAGPVGPDAPVGDVATADRPVVSDASDASDGPFCASDAHDFCDDFEGVRTIQGPWSAFFTTGTATAAIEAGTFVVDMRRADAAALEVPGGGFALDVPSSPPDAGGRRRSHIAFRGLVEVCPGTGEAAAQLAVVGLNGKEVQVIVDRQGADCVARLREIASPGPVYRVSTTLLVPVGSWAEYGLELPANAPGTGGQAKLELGVESVLFDLTATPEPDHFYGLVGITQGTYAGTTARVRFDDVRIDYRK